MKALLIARESPVRFRLAEMISELPGIQLEVTDLHVEAELILPEFHPDVILIDIDQPQAQNLEAIRRLRKGGSERSPVIMALAGSGSLHYRAGCHDAGAMYFFNLERELEWLLDSLASIREQQG